MREEGTGYVRNEAIARVHAHVHRLYNMQDKAGHWTIVQLSGLKPAMLVSSVQAVVACCAKSLHFSVFHFGGF